MTFFLSRNVRTPEGIYRYRWSEIFLVIAVFTKELGSKNIFGIDFDFIGYPFFIVYFATHLVRIATDEVTPRKMFLYMIVSSIISVLLLDLNFGSFLKQIVPLVTIVSVSFYVLKQSNLNVVFLLYVKVTFWTAVFGIIQVILSYFGIDVLIKIPGRLDSIAYEPSHYAAIMMPALVYTFLNFRRFKSYFFVLLTALLLTYNLTAYLVFLTILTFASFNPFYVLLTIPMAYYILFYILPTFSTNFYLRFTDTFFTLNGSKQILRSSLEVNGTTLSFYSNFQVTKSILAKSPLIGAGLGGHEEMYYRHFRGSAFVYNILYGLNAKSAHSLGIRILSEFGLVGAFFYLYILVRNLFFAKGIHYAVALGCVSHFLCKFFKLGGYIDYGTPFFFAMLLLNARQYRATKNPNQPNVQQARRAVPVYQAS